MPDKTYVAAMAKPNANATPDTNELKSGGLVRRETSAIAQIGKADRPNQVNKRGVNNLLTGGAPIQIIKHFAAS